MREVRRKTADKAAVSYLMKAAGEGAALSWDHYEAMLPQDGFGALGLACMDCLLGPCRLNPFEEEEAGTVCGLSRDELALRQLRRIAGLPLPPEDGLSRFLSDAAQAYALRLEGRAPLHEEQALQVGLGVLDPGSVNICLESPAPAYAAALLAEAKERRQLALDAGARGFGLYLAGEALPGLPLDVACDSGGAEPAVLTRLIELYVAGRGFSRAKNALSLSHTVLSAGELPPEELLTRAARAFSQRARKGALPGEAPKQARFVSATAELLSRRCRELDRRGLILLGGSSNLKLTQDEALCGAVKALSDAGLLCLAQGNAATVLIKHGLAGPDGPVIPVWEVDPAALTATGLPCAACFPELLGGGDLLALLAMAAAGVPALTSTRLPAGCGAFACRFNESLGYVPPGQAVQALLSLLSGKEGARGA